MNTMNKVIIVGTIGSDPQVRRTLNGGTIASLVIVTTYVMRSKESGELEEREEHHRVVCFNQIAEQVEPRFTKGTPVQLEGRLQTRSYFNDKGMQRFASNIIAEQIRVIGQDDSYRPVRSKHEDAPLAARPLTLPEPSSTLQGLPC